MNLMNEILDAKCDKEELIIFWLGQNSFIFKSSHSLVGVDLYLSRVYNRENHLHETPLISPDEVVVDYIFCTHDHLDHLDPYTISFIYDHNPEAVFISTSEGKNHFRNLGIPEKQAIAMTHSEELKFGDFMTTAYYSIPKENNPDTTHLGYLFTFEACKIYNMGDSDERTSINPVTVLEPVVKEGPDVAILPIIGDIPSRTPLHALRFAELLNPKIVIPSHYGCFEGRNVDPRRFSELFINHSVKPVIIDYGGNFKIKKRQ